jgi:hypothetical protein
MVESPRANGMAIKAMPRFSIRTCASNASHKA